MLGTGILQSICRWCDPLTDFLQNLIKPSIMRICICSSNKRTAENIYPSSSRHQFKIRIHLPKNVHKRHEIIERTVFSFQFGQEFNQICQFKMKKEEIRLVMEASENFHGRKNRNKGTEFKKKGLCWSLYYVVFIHCCWFYKYEFHKQENTIIIKLSSRNEINFQQKSLVDGGKKKTKIFRKKLTGVRPM